jgi:hypothetical protein
MATKLRAISGFTMKPLIPVIAFAVAVSGWITPCDHVTESLTSSSCSNLHVLSNSVYHTGFQLSSLVGCLKYKSSTFDVSSTFPGDITPQNVCRLALYGDKAKSYDHPLKILPTSYGITDEAKKMKHW